MNDNQFPNIQPQEEQTALMPGIMTGVFILMFLGLAVSGITAYVAASSTAFISFLVTNPYALFGFIIAEVVLVLALSAMITKLSSAAASIMFFLYSFVNGLTLSVVLLAYAPGDIVLALACAAAMFAVMAAYGVITKSDLSSYRGFLFMGLAGIIIATLLNVFMRNSMLDTLICYVGIFIFVGLTAYDTQRIKKMLAANPDMETAKKIRVIGALMLYLDFINIALKLLRLIGRRN